MSESFIDQAHAAGLLVHGYTFSRTGTAADTEYQRFFGWGMDGVFSNYTDLALASRATFLSAAAIPEPETWAMFAMDSARSVSWRGGARLRQPAELPSFQARIVGFRQPALDLNAAP